MSENKFYITKADIERAFSHFKKDPSLTAIGIIASDKEGNVKSVYIKNV